MSDVIFRTMTIDDLDGVMEVERLSFPCPWSRESFVNELTINHFASYTVAEFKGKIIGYCGVWIIVDEAHITNIAIHPHFRGRKIGEALLIHVMKLAKEKGAFTMTLEVRVSNHVAQSLYRKLGFQNGGIRKNYYTDNQEDAQIMWVKL
ncbi:ribosomal protein S18-alanine N-acetyltransferase [Aeribacillus pallidus]|uniref:ribosomal protein S18-alanine N-acetyltransferase n=1 Tax=Aeribacillus pallidus TaxID=33936 RepID=UPI003D23E10F